MIITVAGFKGGVAKTTTAIHIAAFFQTLAPTLLLDADQTKNATAWDARGEGLGFKVAPIDAAAKLAREFTHVVIDTGQRPSPADLQAAAEGCDLMIVPSVPSTLDTFGLGETIRALQQLKATNFRVLLTKVAADAAKDALELRALLKHSGAPCFDAEIPRLKAFEKAAGAGQLVHQVNDRNADRAWGAYEHAGQELQP